MKFFEATNGYTGYNYVRCYVWASDEDEARVLSEKAYKEAVESKSHGVKYWENIELELLVDTEVDMESFYTEPTD